MVARHAVVDLNHQSFVVGVAGKVAVVDHPQPDVSLLRRGNQPIGERLLERGARSTALVALSLKVEFECFPNQLERELEALNHGIADEVALRQRDRLTQPGDGLPDFGLAFEETLLAHGESSAGRPTHAGSRRVCRDRSPVG